MNDKNRIYHVVTYPGTRRSPYAFCGTNAKRDAERMAKKEGGKVRRMTGEERVDFSR